MPPIATRLLRRYLSGKPIRWQGCLHSSTIPVASRKLTTSRICRDSSTTTRSERSPPTSFRKQLKDEAKARKGSPQARSSHEESHPDWELTVGVEIHAQLNTPRKLFSPAVSTIDATPNTHVALFDLAVPGTQPIFQTECLIPAIRAALALNCRIEHESRFDRKHYFHWDQPQGYQITQYYSPFAKDGKIVLYERDGIAQQDGDKIEIGIKQVQMEQDTAKTIAQPGDIHLLDFNRVGLPLIEIITMPEIHYPSTAAALVRKVQRLLEAVDACVLGMESGGLRADVNVSVRRRGQEGSGSPYAGVSGLGQRTEIKNLSSFKAVKDAIIAERDRQIEVLGGGGSIESETRGWTIGSTETRRLRGKEGEVDYRYMPDPDVPPLLIAESLVNRLQPDISGLPDTQIETLIRDYGITEKDAVSLLSLDDGRRLEYFYRVFDHLISLQDPEEASDQGLGRKCSNWILHELGGLVATFIEENALGLSYDGDCIIPAEDMAYLIYARVSGKINGVVAKRLLSECFASAQNGEEIQLKAQIKQEIAQQSVDSTAQPGDGMSGEEGSSIQAFHLELAEQLMEDRIVKQVSKGQVGKVMFLVGQMMRSSKDVDPKEAEAAVWRVLRDRGVTTKNPRESAE